MPDQVCCCFAKFFPTSWTTIFYLLFLSSTTPSLVFQQYIFPCKLFDSLQKQNSSLLLLLSYKQMSVFALSMLKNCITKIAFELLILFINYYCISSLLLLYKKKVMSIDWKTSHKKKEKRKKRHRIVREKKAFISNERKKLSIHCFLEKKLSAIIVKI